MSTPKPRISLPASATAGEVIIVKALIGHPMESGHRRDSGGSLVPRQIINRFTCEFEGETVFSCDIAPAISANPFFEFKARVPRSGTFLFSWFDDNGSVYTAEQSIEIS